MPSASNRQKEAHYQASLSLSVLINKQAIQPRLRSNNIQRLLHLQHPPTLAQPILTQHLRPTLQTIHLTRRRIQIPLLEQNLGPTQHSLHIRTNRQSRLLEQDL